MNRDRVLEIVGELDLDDGDVPSQLCSGVAAELSVTGSGLSLIDHRRHRGSVGFAGSLGASGEELQFSLGEGPAIDAGRHHHLVVAPDLAQDGARWMVFGEAAVSAGIAAVFAAPLRFGVARVGALTVYQGGSGPLTQSQYADLLALADVATRLILALQADADRGTLAAEVADVTSYRPEVDQASGMVAAQMGVPVTEALTRLRAHAYAEGRTLAEVARDVVARRLRLDPG